MFDTMAGKPRFTAAQIQAAIIQHRGLLFMTAKSLGCSYSTLRNYLARYPSVRDALDSARGELIDTAELKLYESILKGEAWGITLCLKTLGRDRGYVERTEVKDVGEVGLAGLLGLAAEARAHDQRARSNGTGAEG